MGDSPPAPEETPPDALADRRESNPATRIHLLMRPGGNRDVLTSWLTERYEVTTDGDVTRSLATSDLCIIDEPSLDTATPALTRFRSRSEPTFYPVLLVASRSGHARLDAGVWEIVDDVVRPPIRQAELGARIGNLLRQRRLTTRVDLQGRKLAKTVEELRLLERAADAAPNGVNIADLTQKGSPIVYVNDALERLTGYREREFSESGFDLLYGPGSSRDAIEQLDAALAAATDASVTLINYRADSTQFWNRIDLAPVTDDSGSVTHVVAFHTDVTSEKIREQRLSVLNRVLRHNLRNDLNVVLGYASFLHERVSDPGLRGAVTEITRSARKLGSLGRHASRIEAILDGIGRYDHVRDVGDIVEERYETFRTDYPDAELALHVEDGPWFVQANGLDAVFDELVENALQYSDQQPPHIEVTVGPDPESPDRVRVVVADDGPGIPDALTQVIHRGQETQLQHGDGLGIWLVHWTTTLLGGGVSFDADDTGTRVAITLPAMASDAPARETETTPTLGRSVSTSGPREDDGLAED